ncbi:MAG TPA: hypothetical protein DCL31_11440 [Clostridium sp.]|nr:hypothetical protein [Clostridium sp.]
MNLKNIEDRGGSESLDSLINKVKNINPEKKWVEGVFSVHSESEAYRAIYLNWKPAVIMVFRRSPFNTEYAANSLKVMIPESTFKQHTWKDDKGYAYANGRYGYGSDITITIKSDTVFHIEQSVNESFYCYWLAIEL